MRRFAASVVFAGCVVAATPIAAAPVGRDDARVSAPPAAVAVQQVSVRFPGVRDQTAMVLVGVALIGIAAAVRRAA
ncbi:MAG TPA: hypothetical protein VFX12_04490 [Vicinamibacterales bacterium]|nr:hypothetical protein [Vicinamibacterales bacterium]